MYMSRPIARAVGTSIQSSSMAGVETKEDKFVYSHHAKDPAYLKLCNAFDIVRIHRFGDTG